MESPRSSLNSKDSAQEQRTEVSVRYSPFGKEDVKVEKDEKISHRSRVAKKGKISGGIIKSAVVGGRGLSRSQWTEVMCRARRASYCSHIASGSVLTVLVVLGESDRGQKAARARRTAWSEELGKDCTVSQVP